MARSAAPRSRGRTPVPATPRRSPGYLGDDKTFDRAIERFAIAYADQNDDDYAEFTQAAEDKSIAVERGV